MCKMHNLSLNEKLTYILFIALTLENVSKCFFFEKIHILCLIESIQNVVFNEK